MQLFGIAFVIRSRNIITYLENIIDPFSNGLNLEAQSRPPPPPPTVSHIPNHPKYVSNYTTSQQATAKNNCLTLYYS